MSGIFVGEEDCIELDGGTRVYILRELSQGADDDLDSYARSQGGNSNQIWTTKLLELAITRIVMPDGQETKPTFESIRRLKAPVSARLREEIMTRWFPLAWAELQDQLRTTSGLPSTGNVDSAAMPLIGSSELS